MLNGLILLACSSSPLNSPTETSLIPQSNDGLPLQAIIQSYGDQERHLNQEWIKCLQPLVLTRQIDQVADQTLFCRHLLSRATPEGRSIYLNRDWLILEAEEHLRPAQRVQAKVQGYKGPVRHPLHRGTWTLKIKIIRLPPLAKRNHKTKVTLNTKGAPPPLSAWSNATVDHATLSEWTIESLSTRQLSLKPHTLLRDLPSPRVGQMLSLELSQVAPEITEGAWALHHPLWFNAPIIKRSLSLHISKGVSLSYFGYQPQESRSMDHAQVVTWNSYLLPSGEGEDV